MRPSYKDLLQAMLTEAVARSRERPENSSGEGA